MPTFVLNDETKVNSYGFRVLNAGIDLKRFQDNPVMLVDHIRGSESVIGKWLNIRVQGHQLLADTEFDQEDEAAKKIEGKVTRGYIKGCSMGLEPRKAKKAADGIPDLVECELVESSVCDIPSNANSVKLYSAAGQLLSKEQALLNLSALETDTQIFNNQPMKQLTLSLVALTALGFTEHLKEGDESRLSLAIEKLASDLKAEKEAHAALKLAHKNLAGSQGKTLIDAAILSGKITEADRAEYEELAQANLSLAAKSLERLPAKITLGNQVNNPAGGAAPKDMDEFEKLTLTEQLAFKSSNPDAYKKLFA